MISFSIIIPTYNRAHLIRDTLDSVFTQTYPHFEVIIVDDGSTDNTKEVIEKTYNSNQRLRYFYKENEERGAARNFGLKVANGQFALFFDSDDLMHRNHLETLNEYIVKLGTVNFIATKHDWQHKNKKKASTIQEVKEGWYDKELFLESNGLACNFCVRVANPNMILFRESRELVTMEDWIFLLENTAKDKIFIVDKTTLTLVDHDERSLTKNFQETAKKRLFATQWIEEHINLSDSEIKRLRSGTYVFCSVFNYLDLENFKSLKFIFKSIGIDGINKKKIMLLIKNILVINKLKNYFRNG